MIDFQALGISNVFGVTGSIILILTVMVGLAIAGWRDGGREAVVIVDREGNMKRL